jgi:hypothetical protein
VHGIGLILQKTTAACSMFLHSHQINHPTRRSHPFNPSNSRQTSPSSSSSSKRKNGKQNRPSAIEPTSNTTDRSIPALDVQQPQGRSHEGFPQLETGPLLPRSFPLPGDDEGGILLIEERDDDDIDNNAVIARPVSGGAVHQQLVAQFPPPFGARFDKKSTANRSPEEPMMSAEEKRNAPVSKNGGELAPPGDSLPRGLETTHANFWLPGSPDVAPPQLAVDHATERAGKNSSGPAATVNTTSSSGPVHGGQPLHAAPQQLSSYAQNNYSGPGLFQPSFPLNIPPPPAFGRNGENVTHSGEMDNADSSRDFELGLPPSGRQQSARRRNNNRKQQSQRHRQRTLQSPQTSENSTEITPPPGVGQASGRQQVVDNRQPLFVRTDSQGTQTTPDTTHGGAPVAGIWPPFGPPSDPTGPRPSDIGGFVAWPPSHQPELPQQPPSAANGDMLPPWLQVAHPEMLHFPTPDKNASESNGSLPFDESSIQLQQQQQLQKQSVFPPFQSPGGGEMGSHRVVDFQPSGRFPSGLPMTVNGGERTFVPPSDRTLGEQSVHAPRDFPSSSDPFPVASNVSIHAASPQENYGGSGISSIENTFQSSSQSTTTLSTKPAVVTPGEDVRKAGSKMDNSSFAKDLMPSSTTTRMTTSGTSTSSSSVVSDSRGREPSLSGNISTPVLDGRPSTMSAAAVVTTATSNQHHAVSIQTSHSAPDVGSRPAEGQQVRRLQQRSAAAKCAGSSIIGKKIVETEI